ncbi:TPA_asm: phage portal protein [Listeria monocytogenes]|uniref:Phage portal protein n=1 Tax=Listeria monocytogenes TaxID=1639 RepID=A0A6Y9E9P0_LISMN|nr:phage portal protein [Listeria monocytogenes]EEP3939417.1 phage portal protein [Listeria monocytogenes serotype 1/2b]EAC2877307.1 phage portal protein [Listeria monocytogenes]EAC6176685.1 phage portal protein [Listeria monocytogenes]EAC6230091.1 phage portal protein [Listeria monocytogenes]EAC9252093.1 phage portal protein [Listeria monocytogenes]
MGLFTELFKRNKEIEWMWDLDFLEDKTTKVYLKKMALNTCVKHIARTIAKSDFRLKKGENSVRDGMYYKLNVRPNTDMSSSSFWEKVIYKLIYDNECLIVLSDTDDFLIADSYVRKEFALYPDVFEGVTVKDYRYNRNFSMDDVIFLEYGNERLAAFTDGMFEDYGELFGRMIRAQMRNFQIRGAVNFKMAGIADDEKQKKLQTYIDKLYAAFNNNEIAIVPQLEGFNYEEFGTSSVNSSQNFDEIKKLRKEMIDYVASILGIPSALLHGDMADLSNNMKAYMEYCIEPLTKNLEDELNAKLFAPNEFLAGEHIKIIHKKDIIENAEAVDKLVASGSFNRNEVRELLGAERVDNPELDKYLITKNYQSADEGGENE